MPTSSASPARTAPPRSACILHIADEFATTELKPELDNPAALPDLRDTAIHDPVSIVEDSSILADQASWRVLPYPAAGSEVIGTAITITRQYRPADRLAPPSRRTCEFPDRHPRPERSPGGHHGTSPVDPTRPRARRSSPFSNIRGSPTLAFFNEHADLRLVRTLQHRGVRRATNFRNALATTSASLEFVDPDLFLLPLGPDVDTTLEASLRVTFASSRVEVVRFTQCRRHARMVSGAGDRRHPGSARTDRLQPYLHHPAR